MKILFTMPVFNEQEGIVSFLEEIALAFDDYEFSFIVVNDCSSDATLTVLENLRKSKQFPVQVINNISNFGHGISTLLGMKFATTRADLDYVITVDGDGQFDAQDIRNLFDKALNSSCNILEGVRQNRIEPPFRKISTTVCRILVSSVAGQIPKDANTPLRIYDVKTLTKIIEQIPQNLLTPNLYISAYARKNRIEILECPINSIERRGVNTIGTTWNQKFKKLPSKRFIKFCLSATFQYFNSIRPELKKVESSKN